MMIPFVIIVAVSKMISLGSIISAAILPIATYFVYYFWYPESSPVVPTVATAVIALLIILCIERISSEWLTAKKINLEPKNRTNNDLI